MTNEVKAAQRKWLVWSNEHNAWWRADACGYARRIDEAGRYTFAEALKHCGSRSHAGPDEPPPEIPVPSPELEAELAALPEPEPVAWMITDAAGKHTTAVPAIGIEWMGMPELKPQALFAHPAPVSKEPGEAVKATCDSAARQLSWRFIVRRSNNEVVPIEEIAAVIEAYCKRDGLQSAPLPEARGAEEAAVEIVREMCWEDGITFERGRKDDDFDLEENIRKVSSIIKKHASEHAGKQGPIDVVLHCPDCGHQHIDAPEPENGWTNPPHRKHLCHYCGHIWLAAQVPTNGVLEIAAAPQAEEK